MATLNLNDFLKAHDRERETATENAKQQQELQRLKLEIKRDELQFKREKLEREKQREQSLKRSNTSDKHDLLLCIVSIISPSIVVFMLLLVLLLC